VSEKKKVIEVKWDNNLLVSKGDEIEITRGIVYSENNVRASHLRNLTNGREERSSIEGVLMTQEPTDIVPPIKGIVQKVQASSNQTIFELVEEAGILAIGLNKLIKEATMFLDKDLAERCISKRDAEDVVTSAFRSLEERIRSKIGASPDLCGADLVNKAFNPKNGKLVFGKTMSEQEGLFHLFRGSMLLLRNPPSHRFLPEYSDFETFEIVVLVNLLLNILEKSQPRQR
jgi:uncharacterized protein (TIGR02391 family)